MNYDIFIESMATLGMNHIQIESLCGLHDALFEAAESTIRAHTFKILDNLPNDIQEELKENAEESQEEQRNAIKEQLRKEGKEIPPDDQIKVFSWEHFCFDDLKSAFGLREREKLFFAPGLARIAFGELGFDTEAEDQYSMTLLKKYFNMIYRNHASEFTENLAPVSNNPNGTSKQDAATFFYLDQMFGEMINEVNAEEYDNIENAAYTPGEYKIIPLDNFDIANKYLEYTYPHPWCYFQYPDTFKDYTNGGLTKLYLAVKPGFENLAPGDKGYGMSMLGIDVNPGENGIPAELIHVSNRYNDSKDPELDNSSNPPGDNRFNATELSNILGAPFWKVCPPYTRDELHAHGIKLTSEVVDEYNRTHNLNVFDKYYKLSDGNCAVVTYFNKQNLINRAGNLVFHKWMDVIAPSYSSNHRCIVYLNRKYNIVDYDGNLAFTQWMDYISSCNFNSAYFIIEMKQKYNILDADGKLIFTQWMDGIAECHDAIFRVELDHKQNMFKLKENRMLLDEWADYITQFYEGGAVVSINGKFNIIDTDGNMLSGQWLDSIGKLSNGFAPVMVNKKWNVINKSLKPISKLWFDSIYMLPPFEEFGCAIVTLNGKQNILKKDGTLRSKHWVNTIERVLENYMVVTDESHKMNLMKLDGNLVLDNWVDSIRRQDYPSKSLILIELNDMVNVVDNKHGKILFNEFVQDIPWANHGYMGVYNHNKYNVADANGNYISDTWFAHVFKPCYIGTTDILFMVKNDDGQYNYLTTDGHILSPMWFDDLDYFDDNLAICVYGDCANYLKPDGTLLSKEGFDCVYRFYKGQAKVERDGETYMIDTDGNIIKKLK